MFRLRAVHTKLPTRGHLSRLGTSRDRPEQVQFLWFVSPNMPPGSHCRKNRCLTSGSNREDTKHEETDR